MKSILINALLLNKEYAGVQYSIEYFIKALSLARSEDCKFTALVSKNYNGGLKETPNLTLKKVSFDSADRFKRIFFENCYLPKFFLKYGFDLYHSPSYTLPYFSCIPSIVTIHDLIALDFPNLCKNETAVYFNIFLPKAIYKSKKIVAVSSTVKKDILERFPQIKPEKIEVIYHGVHPRFKKINNSDKLLAIKRKYALPDKYLFFIGNLEPKKNLNRIIKAFCELKEHYKIEHKLIIAGKKGWKFSSIIESAENTVWHDDIRFLGYIDEEELPSLYSLAEILLFPSLYEGFGLPVLEAMACACPVIVSDRGSLPEISGGLCPMVDPENSGELALAILDILNSIDYKDSLIQKGLVWSRSFTWENAAVKALNVYNEVE